MNETTAILLLTKRAPCKLACPIPGVARLTFMSERAGAPSVAIAPDAVPVRPTDPLTSDRHGVRRVCRPGAPFSIQAAMPSFAKVAIRTATAVPEAAAIGDPVDQLAVLPIAQTCRIVVAAVTLARAVHDSDAIDV